MSLCIYNASIPNTNVLNLADCFSCEWYLIKVRFSMQGHNYTPKYSAKISLVWFKKNTLIEKRRENNVTLSYKDKKWMSYFWKTLDNLTRWALRYSIATIEYVVQKEYSPFATGCLLYYPVHHLRRLSALQGNSSIDWLLSGAARPIVFLWSPMYYCGEITYINPKYRCLLSYSHCINEYLFYLNLQITDTQSYAFKTFLLWPLQKYRCSCCRWSLKVFMYGGFSVTILKSGSKYNKYIQCYDKRKVVVNLPVDTVLSVQN